MRQKQTMVYIIDFSFYIITVRYILLLLNLVVKYLQFYTSTIDRFHKDTQISLIIHRDDLSISGIRGLCG